MKQATCLNWNIGAPSVDRAKQQLFKIHRYSPDIIALTETRNYAGTQLIEQSLQFAGYHVHCPKPEGREYGALIATRTPHTILPAIANVGQEPRAPCVQTSDGLIIAGLYVPSNARDPAKRERKRRFLRSVAPRLHGLLDFPAVVLADTNTISSAHQPLHGQFEAWELAWMDDVLSSWQDAFDANPQPTWISHQDERYRYDYTLTSPSVTVKESRVLDELRTPGPSDHAGLLVTIEWGEGHDA